MTSRTERGVRLLREVAAAVPPLNAPCVRFRDAMDDFVEAKLDLDAANEIEDDDAWDEAWERCQTAFYKMLAAHKIGGSGFSPDPNSQAK